EIRHPEISVERFLSAHPFESQLAVAVNIGEEFSGRLYVLNPRWYSSREAELAFLDRFAKQVMPSIYNVYLWRRLKTRVGAVERGRMARELHDGVIQSLACLVLAIEAGKTNSLRDVPPLLRNEIQKLRELITQLRSVDVRPGELVPLLVDITVEFERSTGISARVASDNEDVVLPPRVCREIVAIVREALM